MIVFVVLHYNNYKDTFVCVNSILELYGPEDIRIIIIDNHSPNDTGRKLKSIFKNDKRVDVRILKNNLGFSMANNFGYSLAKAMNPEYIIMTNNDIIIEDKQFLIKFRKSSLRAEVICPDIINKNGQHQNPLRAEPMGFLRTLKNIFQRLIILLLSYIPFLGEIVCRREINREERWFSKYYNTKRAKSGIYNFVPFGAFIIFSKKWIENEEFAFPSDTFMYCEEDFLSRYLLKKHYRTQYRSDLKVKHLEGKSVESTTKTVIEKMRFRYKFQTKSLVKYLLFMLKLSVRIKYD